MWLIVQQPQPDDFVLATGESQSVRELVELAFAEVGIEIQWQGSGVNERGLCGKTGHTLIRIDPRYFRPTEVDKLIGGTRLRRAANFIGSIGSAFENSCVKWYRVISSCLRSGEIGR